MNSLSPKILLSLQSSAYSALSMYFPRLFTEKLTYSILDQLFIFACGKSQLNQVIGALQFKPQLSLVKVPSFYSQESLPLFLYFNKFE